MERRCTKSEEISELLRNEILSGKFDGTNKLPSEHQLMRRFSVARETVRAAIMSLQGKHLVDRRPKCGTFLSPGATMRAREKIGLIVPESEIDFYWRICRGVEERAHARGWSVLTAPCGYGTMRERFAFVDVCVRERVAGVLVQPVQFLKDGMLLNRRLCEALAHAGLQIGLIDQLFTFRGPDLFETMNRTYGLRTKLRIPSCANDEAAGRLIIYGVVDTGPEKNGFSVFIDRKFELTGAFGPVQLPAKPDEPFTLEIWADKPSRTARIWVDGKLVSEKPFEPKYLPPETGPSLYFGSGSTGVGGVIDIGYIQFGGVE